MGKASRTKRQRRALPKRKTLDEVVKGADERPLCAYCGQFATDRFEFELPETDTLEAQKHPTRTEVAYTCSSDVTRMERQYGGVVPPAEDRTRQQRLRDLLAQARAEKKRREGTHFLDPMPLLTESERNRVEDDWIEDGAGG